MTRPEIVKRFLFMIIGLTVTALGLAVCVRADLGISPITTLAFALNKAFPALTLGTYVFFQHVVFFILTVALLRKDFKRFQLLQLPCSFLFGYFVDFWELLLRNLSLNGYIPRILLLLVGCVIVALGFSLSYTSRVALEANTAFLNALSLRTGKPYGTLKTLTDVLIVVMAAVVALIFLHTVVGIREGTVIAALIIGPIAGFFNRRLAPLEAFFQRKT